MWFYVIDYSYMAAIVTFVSQNSFNTFLSQPAWHRMHSLLQDGHSISKATQLSRVSWNYKEKVLWLHHFQKK